MCLTLRQRLLNGAAYTWGSVQYSMTGAKSLFLVSRRLQSSSVWLDRCTVLLAQAPLSC